MPGSSDDRKPIGCGDDGGRYVLLTVCQACWRIGGILNAAKLVAFKVRRVDGRLVYSQRALDTTVGPVRLRRGGRRLVGVPLVMGEPTRLVLQAVVQRLATLGAAVLRLRPSYILVLRLIIAFAVLKLDYICAAAPPSGVQLCDCQRLIDSTVTTVLGLPMSMPYTPLRSPLASGGFGSPC